MSESVELGGGKKRRVGWGQRRRCMVFYTCSRRVSDAGMNGRMLDRMVSDTESNVSDECKAVDG